MPGLTIGIVDANDKTQKRLRGAIASMVGLWLRWEVERAGVELVEPKTADIVLLVHAGSKQYRRDCVRELRRHGVNPDTQDRRGRPYVITGGAVDAAPFLALSIADCLVVGEGYQFVRELLAMIVRGASLLELGAWAIAYPHAIEASQTYGLDRDATRPWLLADRPPILAEPDTRVDWTGVIPIRGDDRVIRLLASKGCPGRCLFCSTTWRQPYQVNPEPGTLLPLARSLVAQGERVQLVSNDPGALPFFDAIDFPLDSQSFTVRQLQEPAHYNALRLCRARVVRLGVEGVSPRLRAAIGKPIDYSALLDLIPRLMNLDGFTTGMFYIPGLPFETPDDWVPFQAFYRELTRSVSRSVCRVKWTAFEVSAPAPLARFTAAPDYYKRFSGTLDWLYSNAANRHFMWIGPYKPPSLARSLADELQIEYRLAFDLILTGNVDLAPTPEDMARLPSEVVKWPVPPAKRWLAADRYAKRVRGVAA